MNGLRTFIALLALLSAGQIAYGATEISGNIEGDTVWSLANGPYIIQGNTGFSADTPGATLIVEPGVEVRFAPGSGLNIFGYLIAKGTEDAPIKFVSSEPNGGWHINIFSSPHSELSYISTESSQGTVASYSSNVNIRNLSGTSELMLFDGFFDLGNVNLTNNRLFVNGGTALVDSLTITGGNASFFDTNVTLLNANITNANSTAIFLSNRPAALHNITISNAEGGIAANFIPNFLIKNASITDISSGGSAVIFDGDTADLSGVSITNSYYGAGLQGSSISLHDVHITDVQSPTLQVNADTIGISDSTFTNGLNTGVSLSGGDATLKNVTVSGFANAPALLQYAESMDASKLVMTNNLIGLYNYNSGTTTIRQSKISTHSEAGAISGSGHVDARQTYWGHPDGPTTGDLGDPSAIILGDVIIGNILYDPWLTEFCETDCHSNIMFLPGIMSSRLYENGEQLWEPGIFTNDRQFEKLYLDETGKSIDADIYTKDILDNGYAYGKLTKDLAELKNAGTINDYEAVPYDWRLSIDDVLHTGTKREDNTIIYGSTNSEPYIENTLRRLAANSKSGKVTIVAHSNGGLVTKALVNKLGNEAAELIDQIILVAVPQLGTPQAIGALLHGYNAGLPDIYPFILSPERARDLARNMPMIYQLLPFSDYYDSAGATVNTPYVTFEDGTATEIFIDRYGYAVTSEELFDFITGAEGRVTPTYNDKENPAVGNIDLFTEAIATQTAINSAWQVPEGIKVHQIAGVGEDTLANITYKTVKDCLPAACFRLQFEDKLTYYPNRVIDGDGTVVVPSALAMSDTDPDVERWWVNLQTYNRFTPSFFRERHASILEIDELRDFIFDNLIQNTDTALPIYISSDMPHMEKSDRLSFTLHSPLALSAIDEIGRTVSEFESTIPGATYTRYGEVQVLTIPTGTKFTLVLTGEDEGSFTLEMEEFEGEDVVATSTFSAIPTSTSTLATVIFSNGSLYDAGALQVDYNGDSIVDLMYTPVLGQTVSIPEVTQITPSVTITSGSEFRTQTLLKVTDLTQLARLVDQLHLVIVALTSLKGKITQEQYGTVAVQLQTMLNTLANILQMQVGIK